MADFACTLDELCVWMRSVGATSARVGDVELTLGPLIAPPAFSDPSSVVIAEAEDAERSELEALLHSSGADITPFLRKRAE